MCGERAHRPLWLYTAVGSSPRVRGTDPNLFVEDLDDRFIPACAGNGGQGQGHVVVFPVHPRVCGERDHSVRAAMYSVGSSPRVRGTDIWSFTSSSVTSFIPACAGNGDRPDRAVRHHPVHPRVCGERAHEIEIPRPAVRFIPACAGNGASTVAVPSVTTVHPRVCGERGRRGTIAAAALGSSPRVRGTALGALPHEALRRFIPACAGNGTWFACGSPGATGSSPRVRGTGASWMRDSSSLRFIPACAGNGAGAGARAAGRAVHPRVCGERFALAGGDEPEIGSSPRVRGTVPEAARGRHDPRFIPACAGNGARCCPQPTRSSVHPRVCGERGPRPCRRVA